MATMIVKHTVADFNQWKSVFDSMQDARNANGWLGHDVLRDVSNPNMVTIINRVKTLEGAKAYGQSPVLKEAMQRGGITSAPEISFLVDEEVVSY